MAQIQDFGNKIGGARKDLWKIRGLILSDLELMNEAERNNNIKKDNVWIKPNYQEMYDKGISRRIIYFIKTIRDAIPTKPYLPTQEYQNGYIEFVSDIRDKTMNISTEDEIYNYFKDVMLNNYVEGSNSYYYTPKENTYRCLNNKLFKAAQVRNFQSIDREIEKKQFLYSDEEKILSLFEFFKYDDNVTFTKSYDGRDVIEINRGYGKSYVYPNNPDELNIDSWIPNTYFAVQAHRVISVKNCESLDAAKQFIIKQEQEKEKQESEKNKSERKTKFTPKQLRHIQRVGDEYRNSHQITGDDMLNVFGFYGGEFGNWLNENDRQANLNYSYEAFADLAKALNISNEDITFKGRLSIAYGARGASKAAAHYEPERKVINLTKMKGAGSLGHEWAHALDHYLCRAINNREGFITETNNEIIEPIVNTMKYKILSKEDAKEILQKEYDSYKKDVDNYAKYVMGYSKCNDEQKKILDNIIEDYTKQEVSWDEYLSYKKGNSKNEIIEKMSAVRKEMYGRGLLSNEKNNLIQQQYYLSERYVVIGTKELRVETDFYRDSKAFDNTYSKTDKRYWSSNIEMFARAFQCYIKDKLSPDRNDYLCGHADCYRQEVVDRNNDRKLLVAYPEGEERQKLNEQFDKMMEQIKEMGLFQEFSKEAVTFENNRDYENINSYDINEDFVQTSFIDMDYDIDI